MPDTASTPEETAEQTARRVIKRYKWIMNSLLFLLVFMYVPLFWWCEPKFHTGLWLFDASGMLLLFFGGFALMYWICSRQNQQFARGLSRKERLALRVVLMDQSVEDTSAIKEILKYSDRIAPEREYVRASSAPEQPDTLLRAAQPSAETAPEQLLRPM